MVRVWSRSQTFLTLTAIVCGLLLAGLLVPLAFGDPVRGQPSTNLSSNAFGSSTPGTPSSSDAVVETTTTAPAGAATGAAAGPVASGPATTAAPTAGATTPSGGGSAAGSTPAPATLTASDVGVTPTTVKLGFLILDLGQTGREGVNTTGVSPKQEQAGLQAWVDDVNARGGILGRKITPVFRVFDATSQDDLRAACIELTEDQKVFAIIGMPGFSGPPELCVTVEHQTPLIVTGEGTSTEYLQKSNGLLFSNAMGGDRLMLNWVDQMGTLNQLQGKKIGIVAIQSDSTVKTVNGALVPDIQKAGFSVAHLSWLSQDQGTAASQIPVEVANMRRDGVDTILVMDGFVDMTSFVQTATGQGWNPKYLIGEWSGFTSDFEVQGMPPTFNALAMTNKRYDEFKNNFPEPAKDARCREIYEKATGEALPRNNGNKSNAAYNTLMFGCAMIEEFELGAKAAGPNLTRPGLAHGIGSLGAYGPAIFLGGTFHDGKTDLADRVRFLKFDGSCTCWNMADTAIHAVRYT
jgi:ABC-type branched-subunit amino acid transport system substrate-binding protein